MAIIAKTKTRELAPKGRYLAHLARIYDIGTQPPFKPGDSRQHQVVFEFELYDIKAKTRLETKEGYPMRINYFSGLTAGRDRQNKKTKLRVMMEEIMGREYSEDECKEGVDIGELLDRMVILKIDHRANKAGTSVREDIESFTYCDEDIAAKVEKVSNSDVYEVDPNQDIPEWVPDWIKRYIRGSDEWVAVHGSDGGDFESKPARISKSVAPALKSEETDETEGGTADDDDVAF